ncbi:MAG: hypothetical protein AABW80_03230 [Nanoarchaeota archaeon]
MNKTTVLKIKEAIARLKSKREPFTQIDVANETGYKSGYVSQIIKNERIHFESLSDTVKLK